MKLCNANIGMNAQNIVILIYPETTHHTVLALFTIQHHPVILIALAPVDSGQKHDSQPEICKWV